MTLNLKTLNLFPVEWALLSHEQKGSSLTAQKHLNYTNSQHLHHAAWQLRVAATVKLFLW